MVDSWRQPNIFGSAALILKMGTYDGLIALDAANLMELTNCSVAVPPRFSLRPRPEVTDVGPGSSMLHLGRPAPVPSRFAYGVIEAI